jgi:hypothetical protein
MELRRTASVLAAAAALAVPATASAAAPWTDPVTIPGAAPTPAPLLITGDGRALALPSSDRTAAAPAGAPTGIVSLDPATGAPNGPARPLSITSVLASAYSRDHYVVAGSTLDGRGTVSDRSHVQVAFGTGGGDLGPLRGITGSTGERAFALAANADGVVAVVLGNTKERRLMIRRPDGRGFRQAFATRVTSQGRGATVAVGAQGDVLMLWEDQHHISARHVGPGGGVGAVHHIGDGVQSRLQAAVESGGRLMAAWVSQRVDEGEAATPASLFFATAAPGHGFGAARHLEDIGVTGAGRYVADPAVRLVTGGASLLAWTGTSPATGRYVVKVMQIEGGHRSSVQTVSDASVNSVLGDLGVNAAGGAGLIWRTGIAGADADGTPQRAFAAVRAAASQPFGAPEVVVVAPAGSTLAYPPRIALAPSGSGALAEVGSFAGTSSIFQVAARTAP